MTLGALLLVVEGAEAVETSAAPATGYEASGYAASGSAYTASSRSLPGFSPTTSSWMTWPTDMKTGPPWVFAALGVSIVLICSDWIDCLSSR